MIGIETLRALLEYDPLTGLFRWRNPSRQQAIGWHKGSRSVREYRRLYIKGRHYMAHIVAWAIQTGEWPEKEVDHRNRKQGDNRWENLRAATRTQNMMNRSVGSNSTTGVPGVSRFGKRFRVTIGANGKREHIGLFDTVEAATVARLKAEEERHGEFAARKSV